MAKFTSLDVIVKSLLLKEGKPIHYYYQYLHYAVAALQELSVTTIGKVNSVELTVNTYKAVPLPCDYVDWVKVGYKAGERIRPLINDRSLNHLYNYENNQKVPHDISTDLDGRGIVDIQEPYLSTEDEMDFGVRTDRGDFRFCVMKERDEMQLSADYPYETVILQYIDGGTGSNAATEVEPLAQDTIEKYILWQKAVHTRSTGEGERMAAEKRYTDSLRLLRARTSDLTPEEVVHAVRSGYGLVSW